MAPTTTTVLMQGESGTGNELIACALHDDCGRKGRRVPFDSANTSPDLLRRELSGHRRGSLSGALEDRAGAFVAAASGTLFIDEIGELPLALPSSFFRTLESRRVSRSDSTAPCPRTSA